MKTLLMRRVRRVRRVPAKVFSFLLSGTASFHQRNPLLSMRAVFETSRRTRRPDDGPSVSSCCARRGVDGVVGLRPVEESPEHRAGGPPDATTKPRKGSLTRSVALDDPSRASPLHRLIRIAAATRSSSVSSYHPHRSCHGTAGFLLLRFEGRFDLGRGSAINWEGLTSAFVMGC